MAAIKRDPEQSVSKAKSLIFTVDSKVTKDQLRVDDKGDKYVTDICKAYDNLKAAFGRIEADCKKALNNKGMATDAVKKELKEAKSKAVGRQTACQNRKNDIKTKYAITADIFNTMNKQ